MLFLFIFGLVKTFTFCNLSLLIAEKLEPSFERLTKNKDKLQNVNVLTNPKINKNSIGLDPFKNKNKDNDNNINRYEIL
jgi:hypothetical protein